MNKIAIVGISGSGKSTFSRRLADKTGLPLFHMDTLFWKGNWQAVKEEEYLIAHQNLLEKDEWIIEGYIDEKMADRVKNVDLVLYLDYSGVLCAWRVLKRWLKHRGESRKELPKEALETLNLKFLWLVLTRGERKNIEEALKFVDKTMIVRLASPKELKLFMENFTF